MQMLQKRPFALRTASGQHY